LEDDGKREKMEMRRNIEKLHEEELKKLTDELESSQTKSNKEISELLEQIERLKETHEEELTLVENRKEQALVILTCFHMYINIKN
jgi:predicted RNase H-like nuclease (RuvC/YqgF family)